MAGDVFDDGDRPALLIGDPDVAVERLGRLLAQSSKGVESSALRAEKLDTTNTIWDIQVLSSCDVENGLEAGIENCGVKRVPVLMEIAVTRIDGGEETIGAQLDFFDRTECGAVVKSTAFHLFIQGREGKGAGGLFPGRCDVEGGHFALV